MKLVVHCKQWLWGEVKAERVTLEELVVLAGKAAFDRSSDEPPF